MGHECHGGCDFSACRKRNDERIEEIEGLKALLQRVGCESVRYRAALERIRDMGGASPGDKKHLIAEEALSGAESTLRVSNADCSEPEASTKNE